MLKILLALFFFYCLQLPVFSQQPPNISKRTGDTTKFLTTGWYHLIDSTEGIKRNWEKSSEHYFVDSLPFASLRDIDSFALFHNTKGELGLKMFFNENSRIKWENATEISWKRLQRLGFILDDRLLYCGTAHNGKITSGIAELIFPGYSEQEMKDLYTILRIDRIMLR